MFVYFFFIYIFFLIFLLRFSEREKEKENPNVLFLKATPSGAEIDLGGGQKITAVKMGRGIVKEKGPKMQ